MMVWLASRIGQHPQRMWVPELFATHYHELTSLEASLEHLVNVHVATLEQNGQVTLLHKIEPGPADKSYGIHTLPRLQDLQQIC